MTEEYGIVIDCSHLSAADLDYRVINMAHKLGWDGGDTDIQQINNDWYHFVNYSIPVNYDDEEDFHISYREALSFACDDAVEWLNETVADTGSFYLIDDNSLYYESVED